MGLKLAAGTIGPIVAQEGCVHGEGAPAVRWLCCLHPLIQVLLHFQLQIGRMRRLGGE